MSALETLRDRVLDEQPKFHRGETEIQRSFSPEETHLSSQHHVERLAKGDVPACYGIGRDLAEFIFESVERGCKTLETGIGISTLMFALKETRHIAITPVKSEVLRVQEYARDVGISTTSVDFVIDDSARFLPQCEVVGLDLVLLDGKHAFPWPVIDWFYTADRLRKGGFMVTDDVQLWSVAILAQFMSEDSRWELHSSFGRALVFQKVGEHIHDVAWHMQPSIVTRLASESLARRMWQRIRQSFPFRIPHRLNFRSGV